MAVLKLCDYGCGKEATHQFKNGKWCCEKKREACPKVKEKRKQTCMEKYGVDHPFKSQEIREKMKQTNIEKYGVENPSQSKEIQEKTKQTNIENYGVDNPIKNREVQEKRKQTCLEKYGVECPAQNKEVQEKVRQTCLEKYGVDSHFKNQEVRGKTKQTNMEKYGVENYTQSIKAKEVLLKNHQLFCQIEEIKIEDNQFKVHCKYSECINSKEKGGWFNPTIIQIHNRIGALEGKTGSDGSFFYCSQQCKKDCIAFNVRSDPNRDNQLPYTQEQLQTFRLEVLTRDNYICQYCGKPATVVHHERPIKLYPESALDPDYAWSCCEKCHYAKGHPKETSCSTGALAAVVCKPKIKRGAGHNGSSNNLSVV